MAIVFATRTRDTVLKSHGTLVRMMPRMEYGLNASRKKRQAVAVAADCKKRSIQELAKSLVARHNFGLCFWKLLFPLPVSYRRLGGRKMPDRVCFGSP